MKGLIQWTARLMKVGPGQLLADQVQYFTDLLNDNPGAGWDLLMEYDKRSTRQFFYLWVWKTVSVKLNVAYSQSITDLFHGWISSRLDIRVSRILIRQWNGWKHSTGTWNQFSSVNQTLCALKIIPPVFAGAPDWFAFHAVELVGSIRPSARQY